MQFSWSRHARFLQEGLHALYAHFPSQVQKHCSVKNSLTPIFATLHALTKAEKKKSEKRHLEDERHASKQNSD